MYFQMMRVISSPSRSTTGFATLILAMDSATFFEPSMSLWRRVPARAHDRRRACDPAAEPIASLPRRRKHGNAGTGTPARERPPPPLFEPDRPAAFGPAPPGADHRKQISCRIARLDGGADIGKPVILVADRIEAAVGPTDARLRVERIGIAGLQRHGGDVAVVLLHDAVDLRIEVDEIIVERLVVAVTDGAVDAQRHGADLGHHAIEIGDDVRGAADGDAAAADATGRQRLGLRRREAAA